MQTIVAILLLTVSPDVSSAAASTETPAPTEAAAKQAKPKKICRAGERNTGTRLAPRICKTQAEWSAQTGASAKK